MLIHFQRALAGHASEMPNYRDLSQAHRAVADGLRFDDSVPLINHDRERCRGDTLPLFDGLAKHD
jgi:hypothetical protein